MPQLIRYEVHSKFHGIFRSGQANQYLISRHACECHPSVVRAYRIGDDRSVQEVVITTDGAAYRGANG